MKHCLIEFMGISVGGGGKRGHGKTILKGKILKTQKHLNINKKNTLKIK